MTDPASGAASFNLATIGPEPDGATPLEAEDLEGLIPAFVATRADLNQVEYENIARALPWAQGQARRLAPLQLLDEPFLYQLHSRMFGDVWRWAGTQRRRETNIGVAPHQIVTEVRLACADARFWHDHSVFPIDERAARIHYRLVRVHPFPNGNGRCTRLLADLYLTCIGAAPFTWGADASDRRSDIRQAYIAALERAAADEYASLVSFGRS